MALTGYDPTNSSQTLSSKLIIFTGFKIGIPYDISIKDRLENFGNIGFPYGDHNQLASAYDGTNDSTLSKIKKIILDNRNKIFKYTTLPNDYDWESNLTINYAISDDNARTLTVNMTLNNNSSSKKGSIDGLIIINDFKQPQWNTSSMPSDEQLLISSINNPNGNVIKSFITQSEAPTKLNEYGPTRTFALVNRILKDTLFEDLGITNTSITMSNNNFNDYTFTIKGIATKDINGWGKSQIPCSGIIEQWDGATIKSGQSVELSLNIQEILQVVQKELINLILQNHLHEIVVEYQEWYFLIEKILVKFHLCLLMNSKHLELLK